MSLSEPSEKKYYLAADVRELDRLAIQEHLIPGFTLMQRAGKAVLSALLLNWPETEHIICFCGSGNNGGDGYVIAALAKKIGIQATVVAVGDKEKLSGDARSSLEMAEDQGVIIYPFTSFNDNALSTEPDKQTVLVDAMLGTGLSGPVTGNYLKAIAIINTLKYPVVAVDIPSGLCSDTGRILGEAVKADLTVTFIGRKLGQILNEGPLMCNQIVFDDLGVPGEIYQQLSPATR